MPSFIILVLAEFKLISADLFTEQIQLFTEKLSLILLKILANKILVYNFKSVTFAKMFIYVQSRSMDFCRFFCRMFHSSNDLFVW